MKASELKEDIEIQLDENQTLLVHFADEGIVFDVWDKRFPREAVGSSWELYTEFMVDIEEESNDVG